MKSAALEAHFEAVTQKPEQVPPHDLFEQQFLDKLTTFGTPYETAKKRVDEILAPVKLTYELITKEIEGTGGELAKHRAIVVTEMIARGVQEKYPLEALQAQLDEIEEKYPDISSIILETAEA